jgi:hypothetical protein
MQNVCSIKKFPEMWTYISVGWDMAHLLWDVLPVASLQIMESGCMVETVSCALELLE